MKAFVEENDFAFPVLLDLDGTASADAGVYSLPSLKVVGVDGGLVFEQSGIISKRTLRRVVDEQLQEQREILDRVPEPSV